MAVVTVPRVAAQEGTGMANPDELDTQLTDHDDRIVILEGAGGGALASSSVSFSPGNPSPTDNEYTTWAAAHAAVAGFGGISSIVIDDSFTSPAVIPAGTWDMDNIILSGPPGGNSPIDAPNVEFASGSALTNVRMICGPLDLAQAAGSGTTPIQVRADTSSGALYILNGVTSAGLAAGAAPLINFPAGPGSYVVLLQGDVLIFAILHAVFTVAGATVTVRVRDGSSVGAGSWAGTGTLNPQVVGVGASWAEDGSRYGGTLNALVYTAAGADRFPSGTTAVPTNVPNTLLAWEVAIYDPSGTGLILTLPVGVPPGTHCAVKNGTVSATSMTVNLSGAGGVEDPASPGTYPASIALAIAGVYVEWSYDGTNWFVVSQNNI